MQFNFKIVTPEKVYVSKAVDEVMLAGSDGYFTILASHSPFVSKLSISTGYYILNEQMYSFSIKGGFCCVENNEVIVITSKYRKESIKNIQEAYDKTVEFKELSVEEVSTYFENSNVK